MRVQVFQHVPFEGLGHIQSWLDGREAEVDWTRFHEGERVPTALDADLLVVLGGPMSANDEAELPWMRAERECLTARLAADMPTLGICLGAQLMARALGGSVMRAPTPEIGWLPLEGLPSEGGFTLPPRFHALQWHGETYELPSGVRQIARAPACEQQAFQVGARGIGLQFHLETDAECVEALLRNDPDRPPLSDTVHDAERIRRDTHRFAEEGRAHMHRLLDWLLRP
jgi:GMP synthase-like glutamine amidotransferase